MVCAPVGRSLRGRQVVKRAVVIAMDRDEKQWADVSSLFAFLRAQDVRMTRVIEPQLGR